MTVSPERMWTMMMSGSEAFAEQLGLESPPEVFAPARATTAVDLWLRGRTEPVEEEEAAELGFFLARVLIETHGGGLVLIRAPGHALDGEWAVTGFERGIAADYHVPFLVSAVRIGVDRSLSAADWYAQLLREGAA